MKQSEIPELQQEVAETQLVVAQADQAATAELEKAAELLNTLVDLFDPRGETAVTPNIVL